jgi:hypothetical protein
MLAWPAWLVAALGAAALVTTACGGDDEIVGDGDVAPIDAAIPDGSFDAENLCPGAVTFEAFAAGLESGTAEFDVAVTEVGNPTNTETSAPNGRVVICLPDADSSLSAEKTDYLTRVDAVPAAVAAQFSPSTIAYPLYVITQAAAETLYTDLGSTFDAGDGQVVVSVLEMPAGTPLTGAVVDIDKSPGGGPFTRDANGDFTASDEIAGGGLILFANVATAGGDLVVTVTPPDGFSGTCTGPATLALTAGQLSGALFACQ